MTGGTVRGRERFEELVAEAIDGLPDDILTMLDNVEIYELDHGIQFQGVQTKPRSIRVAGKIGFSSHPMLEHFKFLKAHTKVTPKMCIPAPSTSTSGSSRMP